MKYLQSYFYWLKVFFLMSLCFAMLVSKSNNLFAQGGNTTSKTNTESIREKIQQQVLDDWQGPAKTEDILTLTECTNGYAGIYPCQNIDLLANLSLSTLGGTAGNDSWGWTDPLDGKEYALMGLNTGTAFVDISNPENPIHLGNLPTHTSSSSWRDIKVYNNYAFVVSEASGHGVQVFDLTELRSVPSPPVTFSETAYYGGFGSAHNIVINEATGFAYGVGADCSGGLHMINIQNPLNPTFAGCASSDGYTHDAQCVIYTGPDATYQGHELCFNSNEDTLTIFDVTDKNNPIQVSKTGYAGSNYTHQGWLTEDHSYFLLGDELDEQNNGHNTRTYIWDVIDLDNPVLINSFDSTEAAIDHNQYIVGSVLYQSNYRAGLRVLDTNNASNGNLSELAFFDTYPSSNSASFNGTWSNYPFFESGVIVVSDIESGLFLLRSNRLLATPKTLLGCSTKDIKYNVSSQLITTDEAINLSVNQPTGSTATFNPNPILASSPTQTSTLTIANASVGNYTFDIIGTTTNKSYTSTVDLTVTDVAQVNNLLPANGATEITPMPTFSWTTDLEADAYILEIATDTEFNNIIYSANNIVGTSHTANVFLDHNTIYYWRVKAINLCGEGNYSTTHSFKTVSLVCKVYNSDDVPIQIVDFTTSTSIVNVPYGGTIVDINVLNLSGTHSYMEDLEFLLSSPATTTISLMRNVCGSTENFDINFDDHVATGTWPCPPTDGGTYQPRQALATFEGENSTGTWTLTIDDNTSGDFGQLNSWGLEICVPVSESSLSLIKTVNNNAPLPGERITYTINIINNTFDTLTDVFISDTLSSNVTFAGPVSLNPPQLGGILASTITDFPILASGLTITAGQHITLTFPVTVNTGLPIQTIIVNTAAITSNQIITPTVDSVMAVVANAPPTAEDDTAITDENTAVVVYVLDNDDDLNNDMLTLQTVGNPFNGTTIISANTVIYTPTTNFSGTDSFTYTVQDTSGLTDIGYVTISINSVNTAPVAVSDVYTTNHDSILVITAANGILQNDQANESTTLSAVLNNNVMYGTLNLQGDGSFTYTPNANFIGTDEFSYYVTDNITNSNTVSVTIQVINSPPQFNSTPITLARVNTPYAYNIAASDTDDETLSITALTLGTATLPSWLALNDNGDGTALLSGTPTAAHTGSHAVILKVSDGVLSTTQHFSITVQGTIEINNTVFLPLILK